MIKFFPLPLLLLLLVLSCWFVWVLNFKNMITTLDNRYINVKSLWLFFKYGYIYQRILRSIELHHNTILVFIPNKFNIITNEILCACNWYSAAWVVIFAGWPFGHHSVVLSSSLPFYPIESHLRTYLGVMLAQCYERSPPSTIFIRGCLSTSEMMSTLPS